MIDRRGRIGFAAVTGEWRLVRGWCWAADDRITLKSLRMLANALDCDLVYALVPRADSMQALIEDRARTQAKKDVLGVEHSMALELQAVGDVEQAIERETKRRTRKRST